MTSCGDDTHPRDCRHDVPDSILIGTHPNTLAVRVTDPEGYRLGVIMAGPLLILDSDRIPMPSAFVDVPQG